MTAPLGGDGGRVFPPSRLRRRRTTLIVIALVAIFALLLPRFVKLTTDYQWFREIGFLPVFWGSIMWRVALFAIGAVVTYAVLFANLRAAGGGRLGRPILIATNGPPLDLSRVLPRLLNIGIVLVAVIAGVSLSVQWTTFMMALQGGSVGTTDPQFGRDIGFYMFKLPGVALVIDSLTTLGVLSLLGTAALYVLRGAVGLATVGRRAFVEPGAARHLSAIVMALLVLTAVRLWFVSTADLLTATATSWVGASYTDTHIRIPAIRVSAITAILSAGLIAFGLARGQLVRYAAMAIIAYAGVGIIGRGILPFAIQRLSVIPNELVRERSFIERHLVATRAAWGLENVTTRELDGDAQLTMADIARNASTIENVRLWERDLVQQTFGQLQEIRTYYDFVSVTDDRYLINGKLRQVHLAARELNTASLPTRTFINEHFTFTHGMGVTVAPVNQVTAEGLPVLFVKDLPPVSDIPTIKLTRPQIYFGELTDGHAFVKTSQPEFDYPSATGDGSVQSQYVGTGGIPVGSFLNRALYAWRLSSLKILLSNDLTDSSRILIRRGIRERARTALPFLGLDTEPYLVVSDSGQLKWILDAYTASRRYPYAQRLRDGTNYMRNSVKIVIDAYDGTVDAFISDTTDQIVRALDRIFPGVFKPMSAMAPDIRRHVRYPGDLFRTQAVLQATYHMRDADAFYHREDQWQIPSGGARDQAQSPFMRHIVLRLPGETNPEFIYMIPFTPRGKDNLAAWMVVRMDGDNYGKVGIYQFPKQSLVFGPAQVANRINQDTEVARQLTLWDQAGSRVIRGELLVIPVEESLIYVQPIFLRAEGGTIPELKRVIVVHGNRVVMSETLERGLTELFGGTVAARAAIEATPIPASGPAASAAVATIREALDHFDRAMAAQRAGNWAEYGREMDRVAEILRRYR
ncbi:MAG TPA: UPF0182 family protein [Gemmatimonadaceae bacterium]|nr:UPF0182 family protein [Gemmatimonadaceae bacterium]